MKVKFEKGEITLIFPIPLNKDKYISDQDLEKLFKSINIIAPYYVRRSFNHEEIMANILMYAEGWNLGEFKTLNNNIYVTTQYFKGWNEAYATDTEYDFEPNIFNKPYDYENLKKLKEYVELEIEVFCAQQKQLHQIEFEPAGADNTKKLRMN